MGATPLPKNDAAFTVGELLAATNGVLAARGAHDGTTCVSTNTREMVPGAVFVALRGHAHDGHAHVAAAAEAGALTAVVEREVDAPPGMTVVRVDSTLRALGDLARLHVERWHALGGRTLVGITGSAGKTTTRVATAALARALFPGEVLATRGNLNNRIGVPMMLFSLGREHRIAVLELGTSEPGEIAELCRMAQPDVGILTLVAPAHLEGLGSIEGVASEKEALFRSLRPAGIAVGNGDDVRISQALERAPTERRIRFGTAPSAHVRVLQRAPLGMTRSRVVLGHADGRSAAFETPLVGEAGALACGAAVAAVEAACETQLSGEQLTSAFDHVDVGEGAARLVPLALASGLALIDDTYNANPASMTASIRTAAEIANLMGRPLVLALGEMRELGDEAARGHEQVGRVATESGARFVIAVGGEARRICEAARTGGVDALFLPSVDDGLDAVASAVNATDLVLVKGSRASGAERIVADLARRHGGATGR